jgi:D-amino-acid dehydrogenase
VSRVVVVGAGIIGASVASSLARRGAEVVVLDPGPPREGSSSANAGHLVPSHVIPFASPGMVGAGLRSLARRDGAFAINPRLRRQLAPWLARFAAASTEANVRRGAPALEWLLGTSMDEVDRLLAAGVDLDHARDGLIQVFTRAESLEAARHEAGHMRALGYPAEEIGLDTLRDAEPLVHDAVGAILLTRDGRLNPALLLEALRAEAVARGAELRTTTVTGIATGPTAVLTTDGPIPADLVVLAAGVWTPELAATIPAANGWSPRLPILPAKGYSITVPDVPEVPHRPLLLMDQRLAVTPMGSGLRITGRFELTDPSDRGIPAERTNALLGGAREALTLPVAAEATQPWSGLRPATPDGLPMIGRIAPGSPVIVAAGHGMLGTTTGPGTGELVAAMVAGEQLPIDVAPLSPERFGRLPRRVR